MARGGWHAGQHVDGMWWVACRGARGWRVAGGLSCACHVAGSSTTTTTTTTLFTVAGMHLSVWCQVSPAEVGRRV